MTEKEKLIAGLEYQCGDPEITALNERANNFIFEYNHTNPNNSKRLREILEQLFGEIKGWINIVPPFFCGFGCNIRLGENFFANSNLTIIEDGRFFAGNQCIIGPNVSIYTINHSVDPLERYNGGIELKDVRIGNNVWIGGSAVLCPGVTLGDNVVVAAGAVVTKSFGSNVLIGGNPAKVIKELKPL